MQKKVCHDCRFWEQSNTGMSNNKKNESQFNKCDFFKLRSFCQGWQLWLVAQDVKNSSYATDFMLGNSECFYGCLFRLKPTIGKGHFTRRPTRVSTGIGILNRASTSGYQSEKCLEQKFLIEADTLRTLSIKKWRQTLQNCYTILQKREPGYGSAFFTSVPGVCFAPVTAVSLTVVRSSLLPVKCRYSTSGRDRILPHPYQFIIY
jgi:hypothetical protein